ncbi:MAG: TonB-dependent receptor [Rhodoferax sp.]|nr:TonB-dependent receptor [Rhodoferax sp.]
MRCHTPFLILFASLGVALAARANEQLLQLPMEALLAIEISSASRKPQVVQSVAAAVFVISRDDIARSGASNIPEALRLAPGVEVARIGNNRWAVSIRGFNGRFANKLLVLKDGRSIYSPLFSGVVWEAEDTLLDDIERIEVIRGPGAAMWGSNAVNGVINIISRSASDTLGTQAVASVGRHESGLVSLRQGFKLAGGDIRLSFKGFDMAPGKSSDGTPGNDRWQAGRIGLRGDWQAGDGARWTMLGETHRTRADDRLDYTRYNAVPAQFDIDERHTGTHLVLRHEQPMADGGQVDWQFSAETTDLNLQTLIRESRQTYAGEFQRRLPLGRHELTWGASYRYSRDRLEVTSPTIFGVGAFSQPRRNWRNASVFVHNDYALVPGEWRLSGGLRLDQDSWSGLQAQPDIRLAWTPDPATTVWSSLSRATRTPSRLELDVPFKFSETPAIPPYIPGITTLRLAPESGTLRPEKVTALELGFRQRVTEQLSIDMSAFVSDYTGMVSLVMLAPQVVSPQLVNAIFTNNNAARARTHGFELAADWRVSPAWRVQSHYSRLYLSSPRLSDPAAAAAQDEWEGRVPRHRVSLRSSWMLPRGNQLDVWLKHTSRLNSPAVPAVTVLDLRYAWRVRPGFELALVGQNLLKARHQEFVADYVPIVQTDIGRSLTLKGTWRF